MAWKVIQWSTGNVGRAALRGVLGHPDLELVGLWGHGADKAGRDAGELCGLPPCGVKATGDFEALLRLDADCAIYCSTADLRPMEAIDDMCRILRSGKNVVSSSVVPLVEPRGALEAWTGPLAAACAEGRTSFFTSGVDPGWANDLVPLVLSGVCERVDSVRILEILNYDTYDQAEVLFHTMGFGQPPDATPILLVPGVLELAWGGVIRAIARGLDVEVEDVRATYERRTTDVGFSIRAGRVEAGTVAGLRFEVQGIVGGRPAIVVEHVTRLRDDLAPEWPQPSGTGCYRILIAGSPSIECDVRLRGEDGDHNTGGVLSTAMRLVNAIPAVCAAPPGLLSVNDLPLIPGRHLLR
jgi:4-hydroxy-tetrahydrodipicolinate reductase